MAGPLDFWKLVKEVSPRKVREEADRRFVVGGVAAPEDMDRLRRTVGLESEEARRFANGRWFEAALPLMPEARHRLSGAAFALALSADDARESPVVTWALSPDAERRGADVSEILDRFPHLLVAAPRHLPLFRAEATRRVIAATARTNTEIALATAIPGILPWTAALLPATSFSDMILLTKNQGMMILRIAAVYGLEVDPRQRFAELGGVVGAAFGWRSIAREVVGAVPGGVGAAAKGAIAYAGTVAAGRAAEVFYATGRRPTQDERKAWYEDATERAKSVVAESLDRLRRKDPEGSPA